MLCPIKVNSNTIELIMQTSCYWIFDLLCLTTYTVAQLKHDLAYKLLHKIPNSTKQYNFKHKNKIEIKLVIIKKLFVIFSANFRSYAILKIIILIFVSCKQSLNPALAVAAKPYMLHGSTLPHPLKSYLVFIIIIKNLIPSNNTNFVFPAKMPNIPPKIMKPCYLLI